MTLNGENGDSIETQTAVEDGFAFAGVPDELQRLWTPYRMAYISGDAKPKGAESEQCPFCNAAANKKDEEVLVVHRSENCFAVLNLFPYSTGHLLICPNRHIAQYTDLTDIELKEMAALTKAAIATVNAVSTPAGFNIGINQGSVAGAGIAAHLHQHIVPRWLGDSNFFPIIAKTRAIPQLLGDTRKLFAQNWKEVK